MPESVSLNASGGLREAVIERVVPGGDGLARLDGIVTLVPGALPGDRVRLRVRLDGARLLRGEVVEVLAPSPSRRPDEDLCPRARDSSCGGCDWPAARLEFHRELKTSLVLDSFRRLGRLSPEEIPEPKWIGSPRNYRLRNRLHLDRKGNLGFFGPRSNIVSDLTTCEIVSKELLQRLPAIKAALKVLGPLEAELSTLENVDGSVVLGEVRLGLGEGLQISSKVNELGRGPFDGFRVVDAAGRVLGTDGASSLSILAGGASFEVSVSSFFQGNRYLLDSFLEEVRSLIRGVQGQETLIDLYAGVGFLTRPLLETSKEKETTGDSSKVKRAEGSDEVIAVEVDASSSRDLEENLRRWSSEGLPPARAVHSTAEAFLSSYSPSKKSPVPAVGLLVADPPRAGLSPEVRRALLRLSPSKILLVSCDPPTLARDLAALRPKYRLERLVLLDLFPQTHHLETMVLLAGKGIG